MILITVMKSGDLQLVRALRQVLGVDAEIFLLFGSNGLRENSGELNCKHGCDFELCMLNAQNFDLVVSFSGPCDPRLLPHVVFLQFFKEAGIPTIEIQHGLFQYGINNTDVGLQVGSNVGGGDQLGIDTAYVASEVIPWGGPDGVGYIKSELEQRSSTVDRDGFVLITTNNNWHVMSDVDRYTLGIALCRLIDRNPDTPFVWKPHPAEKPTPFARQLLDMAAEYEFPNLVFDSTSPAEDLIYRCRLAITSVSTTLLDYQLAQKPTIVFAFEGVDHLVDQITARSFRNAHELLSEWEECQRNPDNFLIDTGVERLKATLLRKKLLVARSKAALSSDWLSLALKYVAMRRALIPQVYPPAVSPAVGKDIVSRLERIERRLRIFDRRIPTPPARKSIVSRLFGRKTPESS